MAEACLMEYEGRVDLSPAGDIALRVSNDKYLYEIRRHVV
jgi:hypothetical protein